MCSAFAGSGSIVVVSGLSSTELELVYYSSQYLLISIHVHAIMTLLLLHALTQREEKRKIIFSGHRSFVGHAPMLWLCFTTASNDIGLVLYLSWGIFLLFGGKRAFCAR